MDRPEIDRRRDRDRNRKEPRRDFLHSTRESALGRRTVLQQLGQLRPVRGVNPITFQSEAGGYQMRFNGEAVCRLDPRLRRLDLSPEVPEHLRPHLSLVLQWAAPHLLALAGHYVLHASAVEWNGAILAFCGSSGVGKTTLRGNWRNRTTALCPKTVLLPPADEPEPAAWKEGEAAVRAGWRPRHPGWPLRAGSRRTNCWTRPPGRVFH